MNANKIKVTKIKYKELEILHRELEYYTNHVAETSLKTDFFNAILLMDILNQLYYSLRNKIESDKDTYQISFSLSEAVLIIKCYCYERPMRSEIAKNYLLQLSSLFDQKIKSLTNSNKRERLLIS
jgi:hypothetical protein